MFNKLLIQDEIDKALNELAVTIQREQIEWLEANDLACPENTASRRTTIKRGRKYAKIIIGNSVRYFVGLKSGVIYASASRSAPNFNRQFGTLWTVDQFDWGEYEARSKPDSPDWVMKPTSMGYMTAVPRHSRASLLVPWPPGGWRP